MANYTKSTNFAIKDSLISGDPAKVVKGTEIDTELTNIQSAVNSKRDSSSAVNLSTEVSNTLPAANGGTGQTTYTNGQLLIGNTATNGLSKATLTAGSNITITNGNGSVTIAATSGTGDVVGPASAVDNGIALFSGTGGKTLKSSAAQDGFINGIRVGKGPGSAVSNNTVFGLSAFGSNTTGARNTGFGSNAAATSTTGNSTTAIGYATLFGQTSGSQNTAVGDSAASSLTTGSDNVAVGYSALPGITTGSENTALGYLALTSSGGAAVTNCSALGYTSTVTGSDQVQLGNASTTTYVYGTVQNRSDERDKADIRDTQLGLNFITALRPVDYKWDMREDYRIDRNQTLSELTHDGTHKRSRYHHGLIAQEVKSVMEDHGIDFGGYQDHKIKGGDDVLTIGYDELIAPMIKAIQELKAELDSVKAELSVLKGAQ
jgi:hypothetical protein